MSEDVIKYRKTKSKVKSAVKIKSQQEEERQIIVHCVYKALTDSRIRIWKSTYLIPSEDKRKRSKLLFAENICYAPRWLPVRSGERKKFTLIFEMLPKNCTVFQFTEKLPAGELFPFIVPNINRNKSDVYFLDLGKLEVIF